MNIAILRKEFEELRENPKLFEIQNFLARKEALDFVHVIEKFRFERLEDIGFQKEARYFGEKLRDFNEKFARDWLLRYEKEKPSPEELFLWLLPFSDYVPKAWGKPHYGYENLDFLLDEILLPNPQPAASLSPEYGMVRYEPTPASVILELADRIEFDDNDVFYDLGAGLGKVTALINLLTAIPSVGVEYQPKFCAYAKAQANKLNLKKVSYLTADARDLDYRDGTVFFLFNPFGGLIFDSVLAKLGLEANKREIRICSYGSSSQPLSELSWLEPVPPSSEKEEALAIFRSRHR